MHGQAYDHAINVAFMQLAIRNEHGAARKPDDTALEHIQQTRDSIRRAAVEGDAQPYREEVEEVVATYQRSTVLGSSSRETEQAYVVAGLLGRAGAQMRLDAGYRPQVEADAVDTS